MIGSEATKPFLRGLHRIEHAWLVQELSGSRPEARLLWSQLAQSGVLSRLIYCLTSVVSNLSTKIMHRRNVNII